MKITFNATVPSKYTADMHFYFMGYILYHDAVSNNLFVLFAKRFDLGKGRFVSVDNPDYENEE